MKQRSDRTVAIRVRRPKGEVSVTFRHIKNGHGDFCFVASSLDSYGHYVEIPKEERERLVARIRHGEGYEIQP
jgi:hypothetical protein